MNKRWLMAFSYIGFIYATLGVIGIPLRFLRAHELLRVSLQLCYVLSFGLLLTWMVLAETKEWWRYAALLVVFTIYGLVARKLHRPEEQVHFFEYGLVGVLLARALKQHFSSKSISYGGAILLAGLVGWGDEILQGHIPGRHYDVHDISLNFLAAGLGLVLYASLFQTNPSAASQGARNLSSSIQ